MDAKVIDISGIKVKNKADSSVLPADQYDVISMWDAFNISKSEGANKSISLYPGMNLIVIQGKNDCFGILQYDVEAYCNPSTCTVDTIKDKEFTGDEIRPEVILRKNGMQIKQAYQPKTIYYPNENTATITKPYPRYECYALSYANNVNVGEATVYIIPVHHGMQQTVKFNITPYSISGTKIVISGLQNQLEYKGVAVVQPDVVVLLDSREINLGNDYTISYQSNDDIGTATIIFTGNGNLVGSRTSTFKIVANLNDAKIYATDGELISAKKYSYTGSDIKPDIVVKVFDRTMNKSSEFNLLYSGSDYVWPGKKTGQITAATGHYTINSKTFNYNVIGEISDAKFTNQTYLYKKTGSQIKPATDIVFHGRTLTKGTDYTISYPSSDYINKGTKSIKFSGANFYQGSTLFNFAIYDDTQTQVLHTDGTVNLVDPVSQLTRSLLGVTSTEDSSIQKVVLGNTVTSLETGLFANFKSLVEVDMSLCTQDLELPESCFENCELLKKIIFPGNAGYAN